MFPTKIVRGANQLDKPSGTTPSLPPPPVVPRIVHVRSHRVIGVVGESTGYGISYEYTGTMVFVYTLKTIQRQYFTLLPRDRLHGDWPHIATTIPIRLSGWRGGGCQGSKTNGQKTKSSTNTVGVRLSYKQQASAKKCHSASLNFRSVLSVPPTRQGRSLAAAAVGSNSTTRDYSQNK